MKLTKSVVPLLGCSSLAIFLSGCASIMCGSRQEVIFDSRPDGAEVLVYDSRGEIIFTDHTPCTAHLVRRDHDFLQGARYVALVKKEGFAPVQIPMVGGVNRAYTANILNGGIGYAIDPITGSMWTLSPEGLDAKTVSGEVGFFKDEGLLITLKPEDSVEAKPAMKAAQN